MNPKAEILLYLIQVNQPEDHAVVNRCFKSFFVSIIYEN